MDTDLSPLKNFWRNTTPGQKLGLALIPAILLAIAAYSLVVLLRQPKTPVDTSPDHINITNFSQTGAPDIYKTAIQYETWNILQYNHVSTDLVADAEIRDGSYTELSATNDLVRAEFLLDIPAIEQTFSVFFVWLRDASALGDPATADFSIDLTCPDYKDVIYKNTHCYSSSNVYTTLDPYLPVTLQDDTDTYLIAGVYTHDSNSVYSGKKYVDLVINSCDDKSLEAHALDFFKSWLRERYLDPDDYLIEPRSICKLPEYFTE